MTTGSLPSACGPRIEGTIQLVLSIMPGIDLLGMAFKEAGFCVVQGGDVIFGGDVRTEHYPPGKFEGAISGPPCKRFSTAAPLRRKGLADNLIPDFERVIGETQPMWFLMECVRRAPIPSVPGYEVCPYLLNSRWFGIEQQRVRRFSFGYRGRRVPLLIEPTISRAARILRTVTASDGKRNGRGTNLRNRRDCLTGQVLSIEETCVAQGLPPNYMAHSPFTKEGRYRVVGNGVPRAMGLALARAVLEATEASHAT